MNWIVYILECKNNFLYTGITNNFARRFAEHLKNGARFTRYNPPVKCLYQEIHPSRGEALSREAAIKKLSKQKKLELIGMGRHEPL